MNHQADGGASNPASGPASGGAAALAAPPDTVRAANLTKRFGDVVALDRVSFDVRAGELFGFIGPDGAGKTTLFRLLVSLFTPDEGESRVLGLDPVKDLWELRRRVGYMPGRFSLYPDLSVHENLAFYASVFGTTVEREMATIAPIYHQLAPFAGRRAAALSGGMKQKLALCCALVHAPEILFLDEPTTGVDAVSRKEFWDLLARLRAGGLTIVVSTPYMDEASRCDRVALMQHGRILRIDRPAAVTAAYPRPLLAVTGADRLGMLAALRAHPHAASVWPFGASLHFTDDRAGADPASLAGELAAWLRERRLPAEVRPIEATIEDAFMYDMVDADQPA
ncbi:MAG TPA: ABC transporter ATP-binding protein [Gemmatimonadaceae bacterium]|nr:ABC transporter ATP-binding protein [Gemmatimonadaceae bacterium]